MIAFLIDADNFSSPAWIDEAFHGLEKTVGSIAIRRAYGSAENLKGLADALRAWAIRPFANLSLPKNTTDLSLAVDAMELACTSPRPAQIVIGSGDLDFLPLVVRLREKGIKVICVTERSKMAQDAVAAYDQVIYVGTEQAQTSKAVEIKATAAGPTRAATKKVASKAPATKKAAAASLPVVKKAAAKKVAVKKGTAAAPQEVSVPKILQAVPSLKAGEWQPLGEVAKLLHDHKLLAKNATSTKLFKKFPNHFEVIPAGKPNKVRFIVPAT